MSNYIDSIQLSGTVYTLSAETSGTTYTAGRGINIDSGNTVSISLPISAGTGTNSIAEGDGTTASGRMSHAEGQDTIASGWFSHAEGQGTIASGWVSHAEGNGTKASGFSSHAEGRGTIANNDSEHASGQWNISSSSSTTFGDSGNTLFSVGNGTADNARHNAFEIRQNGDIYLSSGGTDIKLQDHLGGGGGNPTVELTQAEYDALVSAGTVASDTYYIITDAQSPDISQYWTSAQTQSAITSAVSGKQDTLVSGTNIKTINNESILGSGNITIQGGSTYTAGRGIDITNDTISVSLPISAGTGSGSVIMGKTGKVKASGNYSFAGGENSSATTYWAFSYGAAVKAAGQSTVAFGYQCHANSNQNFICGYFNNTNNDSEFGCGKYNISNTGSTASAQTLFSVGNGTADNARHNAFEIRQNGDIYLTKDGVDIKLQDNLGGGGSITVDPTLDSGSTNPVANSAITTALDAKQDTLVSGTNIKTINNQSILGSGNIEIQGSVTVDQTIISGSTNPVAGGAVYDALGDIEALLASI